jgi:hypothetical protein
MAVVASRPPPSRTRGDVKGAVLQSRLAYVEARLGKDGWRRVLARLPEGDRPIVSGVVLPMTWYPFALDERLLQAIGAEVGRGDVTFRELGAQSASDNLASTHSVYVRSRDPHGLLKHTAQIYKLYYNTGYRTYEWVTAQRAVLRTFESESFSPADCLTVVGWHERAIEMCGGKTPMVTETKCRARGDTSCEYSCTWR